MIVRLHVMLMCCQLRGYAWGYLCASRPSYINTARRLDYGVPHVHAKHTLFTSSAHASGNMRWCWPTVNSPGNATTRIAAS